MTKLIAFGVLPLVFFLSSHDGHVNQPETLPAAEIMNSDKTEAGIYFNRPVAEGKTYLCCGVIDQVTGYRKAEGTVKFKPIFLNGSAGIVKMKTVP